MFPDRYTDPMSWFTSRGRHARAHRVARRRRQGDRRHAQVRRPGRDADAVPGGRRGLAVRAANKDRLDRLRAFASALGAGLRGKVWLMALGQQKIDEDAGESFLVWAKDRFPPKLRVHLANTNIRDVVHRACCTRTPRPRSPARPVRPSTAPTSSCSRTSCDSVTADDFVEVYPLLPGLRRPHPADHQRPPHPLGPRAGRRPGDPRPASAARRAVPPPALADQPVGALIALDQVYEVQHTALDSETRQHGPDARECADEPGLMVRAAKVVALLEQVQDDPRPPRPGRAVPLRPPRPRQPGRPGHRGARGAAPPQPAQRTPRSSATRSSRPPARSGSASAATSGVSAEAVAEAVQESLRHLLAEPERPRLQGRPFPWQGVYGDGQRSDAILVDPRDEAVSPSTSASSPATSAARALDQAQRRARAARPPGVGLRRARPGLEVGRELGKSRAMVKKLRRPPRVAADRPPPPARPREGPQRGAREAPAAARSPIAFMAGTDLLPRPQPETPGTWAGPSPMRWSPPAPACCPRSIHTSSPRA
jgi:hypothetical protein